MNATHKIFSVLAVVALLAVLTFAAVHAASLLNPGGRQLAYPTDPIGEFKYSSMTIPPNPCSPQLAFPTDPAGKFRYSVA